MNIGRYPTSKTDEYITPKDVERVWRKVAKERGIKDIDIEWDISEKAQDLISLYKNDKEAFLDRIEDKIRTDGDINTDSIL